MFSVHRLNIRVVGCNWIRSPSRKRVGLLASSRLRSSLGGVGCLNYIRLGCFLEGETSLPQAWMPGTPPFLVQVGC